MIASNIQRQKYSNLGTIWGAKVKGAYEHSKSLQFAKHLDTKMQTLTRMDKVVIEDYYHMTVGDENVNWMKLT